jgi:uncharacterized repeat protein (TIGR01451 family)
MDRTLRFLLTIFAVSAPLLHAADPKPDRAPQAAIQAAGAGNTARTIRLKSEEFVPAGEAEANLDRVKAKYANRPVVHVILQFEELPTEAQRKELRARGVKLMGYLPDRAYFASVPARVKAADLKPFRVHWAGAIYKEDKSAPRIRAEGFGGWALRPGGNVELQLNCFEDADLGGIAASIAAAGGQVVSTMPELNRVTVIVPTGVLDQLADLDEVRWIEDAPPPPKALNDGSRANVGADIVQSSPYNLSGSGVALGIWDGGSVDSGHDDFAGRLTLGEPSIVDEHATHVAGTMAGSGALSGTRGGSTSQWRGMAPSATMVSYDFYGNVISEHNNPISAQSIMLSQNSWGYVVDSFFGNCSLYGDYASLAPDFDQIVTGLYGRGISVIFAAGNSRDSMDCGLSGGPPNYINYRNIAPPATAKNIISVGAINSDDSSITAFSSWGPVDDGRIKPDMVAPGCEAGGEGFIKSTLPGDSYGNNLFCGTSMAAPAVSGVIALMIEDYRSRFGTNPLPATLKAILLHTAEDLDDNTSWYNKGPDYASGYGRLQAQPAIDQIRDSGFLVGEVGHGETNTYVFSLPAGVAGVKLTLVWDDPAALANAAVALVNDLDLVVFDPGNGRRFPWTLDPANPSLPAVQNAEDHLNVVEQVYADGNIQPGAWTVRVVGRSVPQGRQSFTLVHSIPRAVIAPAGFEIASETCGTPNGVTDPYEIVGIDFVFRNAGAIPTSDLTATLLGSENVVNPSGSQVLGVLEPSGGTSTNRFTFKAIGECGATIPVQFQLQDGTNDMGIASFVIQLGVARIAMSENFDSGTPGDLPQGWTATVTGNAAAWTTVAGGADGTSQAAFAPSPSVATENRLFSPAFLITDPTAALSFRHSYNTETCCDRGTLLISIDNGPFVEILAAGGRFRQGGYNGAGWSGNSRGFVTTLVDLPLNAAGSSVQFQWRLITDAKASGSGWYVDSVVVQDGFDCCRPDGLSVALVDTPDPVVVDSNLTYTVTVYNTSAGSATGVVLTDTLAPGVTVLAIQTTHGSCTQVGQEITCNIGTIVAGGTASVVINTRATIIGTVTNVASVVGNEPDVEPLNNTAHTTTVIRTAGVPELIPTLLEGPSVGSTGGSILITNEVRNIGYTNAVLTFRVTFYLSPDEIITTNDIHIGSRSVFGLATNESSWGVSAGNIPVDIDPGVWYFGALVDFNDEIEELNEANNQLIAGTMQIVLGPDMTMTSLIGPAVGAIGGTIRLESQVDNIGTGNPGNFAVGYYLSTDSTITTNDLRIGSHLVSTLPPNQFATGAVSAAISSSVTPGFYYLGAIADFSGAIAEADELNNAILGSIIEVKLGVDLVMQSVAGPTNAPTGREISITNVMANIGSNNAAAFSLGWYLSPDLGITTNDQRIGTRNIGFLAAGASVTNILTVAIPLTNRPGLYYLGCVADYPNAIPEVSETNNILRGNSIQITVGPDIAMTRVTGPVRGSPGSYMLLTNVVSNVGTAPPSTFSVGFYLSADPDITTSDTRIGTRNVATLLPGTNSTSVVTVTISATFPKGTYYLGAIADFLNVVQEISETNNTFVIGSPIEILNGFDLITSDVRGPTNSYTGATLLLTNMAQNIGIDNVGTFTVGLYISTDPNITTNDTRIGTRSVVGGLQPNGRSNNATSVTIPVTNAPGLYWFGAVADHNNLLPEPNETNNYSLGNAVSIAIGPDLSGTLVAGPPLAGQSTRVTVTTAVRNAGFGNPGPFGIGIYLSTDQVINSADTLVGIRYIAGLAPGLTSTGTTQVTISGNFTSGSYYWGMIADLTNGIPEITETNNARVGNAVTIQPLIDLVMTTMSGPDAWCTGNPFQVSNVVQNIGSAGALPFMVGLYLSEDPIITPDDMLMYTRNLTGLGIGQISPNIMTLINIGGLNSGTYYYGAIADPGQGVTEANEENNAVLGNAVAVTLGPDLVLKDIIVPQYGSQGSSLPVTMVIANEGCGNAPIGFGNGIYLSPDPQITTADMRLGSRTINTLTAGHVNTGTLVVALSPSIISGTYYLGVIADYGNAIYEVTDTNNVLLGTPIVIRPASDLVVGQVGGPTNACTGKSIIISNIVMNIGTDNAGNSAVGIYLSTDTNITTADLRLGSRAITSLGPGQTNAGTVSAALPLTLNPGTYYIGALADYLNQLPEADEQNNGLLGNLIEIAIGPELLMAEVGGPAAGAPGSTISITNVVRNIGCGDASAFTIGIYLSSDPVISVGDLRIGTRPLSTLQSGVLNTGVTAIALSGTLSNGLYYLGAIADYNNLIREGSETNNWLATMTIDIRAGIDLAVASASVPATAVTGSTLTLSNVVRNLGTDNAPVSALGVYLSTDPIITTSDTRIGAPSIAAIIAGQSITNGTAVYIPNYVTAGSYYLGVIADYANALPETDEVNNILTANAIDITLGADLTVRSVTGPLSVSVGTPFSVSNVVQNIGAGDSATNSRVGVYLSDDAVITTGDVLLGFRNINSILAGTTNIGGNSVTVPQTVAAGAYYIGAIVDYQERVVEISEANNAMGYQVLVGMTPFRITQIRIDGADVLITFESLTGQTYAVQEAQSIGGAINWVPVTGAAALNGTGSTIEFRHTGAAGTAPRFYRIQQAQ